MSLTLTQNFRAVVNGADFVQFVAIDGTPPYTYSVLPSGAGGVIDVSTGNYTAPSPINGYPATSLIDTIQVLDSIAATATATILVGTPLFLVCDILQTYMQIPSDHIYLWDQKVFQPTDSNLYVAVSMPSCRPFGNYNFPTPGDGSVSNQFVSMYAKIDFDILSRGPAARDQKELVVLALNSTYSQQQQQANGFYISKLPLMGGFVNLSQIDGAAIPYRYKITHAMQYQANFNQTVPYYDSFQTTQVYTNP